MKIEKVMQRDLHGTVIRQNHKNGTFNLNDLEAAASSLRETEGKSARTLSNYFAKDSTAELIQEISLLEGLDVSCIKISKRGERWWDLGPPDSVC